MSEDAQELTVPAHNIIEFYDSVDPNAIPESATYAALYADGEFAVPSTTDIARFTHRRWITVEGLNHHVGIADFEYPNPVFTVNKRLYQWAASRLQVFKVPGIVYSDLSDVHRAQFELTETPVFWWIATRDRGVLTPVELVTLLETEFNTVISPNSIWAHQYDNVGGEYDISRLYGKFYQ